MPPTVAPARSASAQVAATREVPDFADQRRQQGCQVLDVRPAIARRRLYPRPAPPGHELPGLELPGSELPDPELLDPE